MEVDSDDDQPVVRRGRGGHHKVEVHSDEEEDETVLEVGWRSFSLFPSFFPSGFSSPSLSLACPRSLIPCKLGSLISSFSLQLDVVVCNEMPNASLFRVQYPQRQKHLFSEEKRTRCRYKKKVRMVGW